WDDHAKVARSEMVSNLHTTEVQNTLLQNGFTADSTLGIISNLVDKEAITMSANHVFLLFAIVFVFAGLVIWLCPNPKQVSGMLSHET
ncbi:MFS transporter, partial [Acinetobacter radioresistens]